MVMAGRAKVGAAPSFVKELMVLSHVSVGEMQTNG